MKKHRSIIALLLIALAIRLAWGLSRPAELSADLPDQAEYRAIAARIIVGDGLQFYDERFGQTEYAFRAPGYPVFVALMGTFPRTVRFGQAVLDTSTVLAIYLLAKRWLDERAALFAAVLVAFNPFLIFFTGLVLSETLFTAAVAWAISLLGRKRWTGLIWLAIAVLVRPAALLLPPLACAVAALVWFGEGASERPTFRRAMNGLAVGAAVSFAVLLPWAIRNRVVLGEWVWTTTNAGQTTFDGFHNGAMGDSDLAMLLKMPELQQLSEVGRSRYLGELGRAAMWENIPRAAALAIIKIERTWSPVPLSDEYGSTRNRVIGLAYAGPMFRLALIGLFRTNLSWPLKSLCVLPAIYFTAGAAITVGSLRYRVPAEPPMCLLAASALCRKSEKPLASGS